MTVFEPAGPWQWRGLLAALVYVWLMTAGVFVGAADAAAIFGLAGVLFLDRAIRRQWPVVDRPLTILGVLFVALCWASALWSIVTDETVLAALQMTEIFVGCLILLGQTGDLRSSGGLVPRAALAATLVGAGLALIDFRTGFPIMSHFLHPDASPIAQGSKMERGLSYLTILVWPVFAYSWYWERRIWTLVLAAIVVALVVTCYGVAIQVALACGILSFALACVAPRVVAFGLAASTIAATVAIPVMALVFGPALIPLASRIKPSAQHRLEIWDYMSRRALERPLGGWGWGSADALRVHADELNRYRYVTVAGTAHPHANWLQLWVETGIAGPILGFAFALLVISRALRMPKPLRPFALACCTTVFMLSLASFDLGTDSWWAALTAAALLFMIMPRPSGMPAP